jgi:hypothetical protein
MVADCVMCYVQKSRCLGSDIAAVMSCYIMYFRDPSTWVELDPKVTGASGLGGLLGLGEAWNVEPVSWAIFCGIQPLVLQTRLIVHLPRERVCKGLTFKILCRGGKYPYTAGLGTSPFDVEMVLASGSKSWVGGLRGVKFKPSTYK